MGFRIRVAFYGLVAATAIVCAGAASPALGQVTQTVLYRFLAGSDGSTPVGALIADARGTLYGTTQFFGAFPADCSGSGAGCGVVFKLTPPRGGEIAWSETTLHSFSGGSDGSVPQAGLFARNKSASPNKPLYGTTSSAFGPGFGTVFKLVDGTLTTLWSFSGGSDGASPPAGLIADKKTGVLYGTTSGGGAFPAGCGGTGCGTVFKIDTTDQTLSTIWSFSGGSDGALPSGGALLADEEGALYGTTSGGGNVTNPICASLFTGGCGTVFKLTPPTAAKTAWTLNTLWTFSGGNDGALPFFAGLIADETGALYGTTGAGGASGNGTVFKLTLPAAGQTSWTLSTLWSFSGGSDGANPAAGLIADRNGVLYGTTENGGAIGFGVVFKLMPPAVTGQTPWAETVLWTFTEGSDGGFPVGDLIADHTGALFGTAQFGGAITPNNLPCPSGCGVVFRLTGTGFATNNGG